MSNKKEFLKPKEGLIVRHPNGRPISPGGEECPMTPHYLKYLGYGDLVKCDKNSANSSQTESEADKKAKEAADKQKAEEEAAEAKSLKAEEEAKAADNAKNNGGKSQNSGKA